ncbi:MAG: TM1266 family iron-only hydrogenase system putative regulator [Clostridiaceae bacterium]
MILSVENGAFSYRQEKERMLLKNINFNAQPGDLIAILGPNGAGKTTLLRCIMGFLHWKSGRSCIDGKDIRSIPYKQLWQSLAYVPQSKQTTASYTVEQMVLLGRSSHLGMFSPPGAEDMEKAHEIMARLHILKLAGKKCTEISGGELQMVLMARALAAEPKILILDEPESNLDFRNQLLVLETMSELAAKGMTCIFNTHYPAHALQRSNKAFLLSEKGDYVFGDVNNVVTEHNIESAFGVKAIIGEIETQGNILQDVVPLRISNRRMEGKAMVHDICCTEQQLAVISIIAGNYYIAEKINNLLHEHGQYIVGRMGMPYRDCGVHIINVTLDAPLNVLQSLVNRLNILPDVNVKTTYAPERANNMKEVTSF